MPIGNVTSQIFANIYLHELDKFIKQELHIKNYFRYADDFIIIHEDREYLRRLLRPIKDFLKDNLGLALHPGKVSIRKYRQGIDFLGYVILPHHIVLRTKTKKRMFRKINSNKKKFISGIIDEEVFNQSYQSYLGLLKHCNGYKIKQKIIKKNKLKADFTKSAFIKKI